MEYLFLVYGASFFALGVLLAFQARLPATVVPRTSLGFFAAFALVHATSEWATMLGPFHGAAHRAASLLLEIASWGLLGMFGVALVRQFRRWGRWTYAVPAALALAWTELVVASAWAPSTELVAVDTLAAASRYGLALPAALLVAHGFRRLGRAHRDDLLIRRLFATAATIFVIYALAAGIVVPEAPFFPASVVNTRTFAAVTHVPIELIRAVCAVALVAVLSRALVIEAGRRRRELERRREEFIAVVAHDLRSPIGVIQLAADALEAQLMRGAEIDRERAAKLLSTIRAGASGLERMVRDLLDASRIETRQLALDLHMVEPRALIADILERVRQKLPDRAVKLVVPAALPAIVVDPLRFEQILVNLLSNAAKFSDPDTEIVVEATTHDGDLELAVTNRGSGLAATDIDKVFSRFYRSKAHARTEGLGLGLYIAKGLVEAQGGHIWAESELGRYATFRFTLPRGRAGEVAAAGRLTRDRRRPRSSRAARRSRTACRRAGSSCDRAARARPG